MSMTDFDGRPPEAYRRLLCQDHVLRRRSDRQLVQMRFIPCGDMGGMWVRPNAHTASLRYVAANFIYVTPVVTPATLEKIYVR